MRCRAAPSHPSRTPCEVGPTAARHRIAISTSCVNIAPPQPKAPRGEKQPFGLLRANESLPMPTVTVSHGKHDIADRKDVPLGIGSRREPRGAAPLSQARHASQRSRASGAG